MKRLLLILPLAFFSSCASLTVGHENFRCEGTDKGGICAPTYYVYQHRNELLQKQIDSSNQWKNPTTPPKVKNLYYEYLNAKDYTLQRPFYLPQKPVRLEEEIQRIWIFPYKTKDGNLIAGHYIYTVVKPARWLYFVDEPEYSDPPKQSLSKKKKTKQRITKEDKIIRSYLNEKERVK